MNRWENRGKKIEIPQNDTPKTYECKVCGSKIVPKKEKRYVARQYTTTGGISNALSGMGEPKEYDCFDCPVCGCQFVAKERLKKAEEK